MGAVLILLVVVLNAVLMTAFDIKGDRPPFVVVGLILGLVGLVAGTVGCVLLFGGFVLMLVDLFTGPATSPGNGSCRVCGYNLTGNVSGICPECGSPVEEE
jgi:hypothetical protein